MNEIVKEQNIEVFKESSGINGEEASIVLFSLIESLSFYVLSGDVWWLANKDAREKAIKNYGVSPKVFDEVIKRLESARKQVSNGNPMRSMFE